VKEMELFQTVRSRRELGAYFEGDKMFGRRGNCRRVFCFVFAHAQSTLNAEFLMDIGIPDAMQHQLIVMRMNLKKKPLFGYSIFDVL
jgi:hypothetical protein